MPPAAQPPILKPPPLRAGDTVGIVAPSSNIKRGPLEAGCAALAELGYRPFYLDSILDHDLYFAGTLDRRKRELEAMVEDDNVRAIICARGGYGINYLLPDLDLDQIKRYPKIFVGYSDITSLMTYITDTTGLITFHGPMVTKDFATSGGVDTQSWQAAISGISDWEVREDSGAKALAPGNAEGRLYGGCLSLLVASLGTPYQIQTENTILFIEDIAAKPYQIDRMLMQLKLAGKLKSVRGLVFGEMIDCVQHKDQPYTLEEVIMRIVGDLGIPVAYGMRSGHVSRQNITLPIGAHARLSVGDSVRLEFLESATSSVGSK
jgi:muramoyltetrapeptide carboxypeptidase